MIVHGRMYINLIHWVHWMYRSILSIDGTRSLQNVQSILHTEFHLVSLYLTFSQRWMIDTTTILMMMSYSSLMMPYSSTILANLHSIGTVITWVIKTTQYAIRCICFFTCVIFSWVKWKFHRPFFSLSHCHAFLEKGHKSCFTFSLYHDKSLNIVIKIWTFRVEFIIYF